MLSEHGWRLMNGRRRAAHVDGVADQFHLTHLGMLDFDRKPVFADLRIGKDFVKVLIGAAGTSFPTDDAAIHPGALLKSLAQLLD